MELKQRMVGKRIVLRATTPDDAKSIFDYTVKFKDEFLKWENSVWRDENEIRDFVRQHKSLAHYVICLDDVVIGTINVWDFSEKRMACQLGWGLNQDYVGHGYMTEALGLLIPELERNGMVRIMVETMAENTRSVNLARGCGFKLEGITKKDAFIRSRQKFVDTAILAIVNESNAQKLEQFYANLNHKPDIKKHVRASKCHNRLISKQPFRLFLRHIMHQREIKCNWKSTHFLHRNFPCADGYKTNFLHIFYTELPLKIWSKVLLFPLLRWVWGKFCR